MREDTSPPPDILEMGGYGTSPSIPPHSGGSNTLTVTSGACVPGGTGSGGGSSTGSGVGSSSGGGRRRLRHQGSSQGSYEGSSPCLSRGSKILIYFHSKKIFLIFFFINI